MIFKKNLTLLAIFLVGPRMMEGKVGELIKSDLIFS